MYVHVAADMYIASTAMVVVASALKHVAGAAMDVPSPAMQLSIDAASLDLGLKSPNATKTRSFVTNSLEALAHRVPPVIREQNVAAYFTGQDKVMFEAF
jgi:hypothetical protein